MRRRELGCALALCLLPAVRDDAAVQLRSAKVDDRLAGVETLRKNGAKDAEALLKGALKDADWEVVERAAAALAERGSPASVDALSKLALDGPARRLRIAAARAMAKLDPAAAAAAFLRGAKLDSPGAIATFAKGTRQPAQTLAIDALANTVDLCGEAVRTGMAAAIADKEDAFVRETAAVGLLVFTGDDRVKRLKACLDDEYSEVATSALAAVRARPDPALLPTLLEALVKKDQRKVVERHLDRAILALLVAAPESERAALAAPLLDALKSAKGPALTRVVRLVGICAAKPTEGIAAVAADAAVEALAPFLKDQDDATRSAAVRALTQVGSDAALDAVAAIVKDDKVARVRDVALRDLLAARGIKHAPTRELVNALANDADVDVREDAVVALGTPDAAGAVELLAAKLKDPAWEVAVAAAVALGRTRDAAALAPLESLLPSKDWKLSAAALAGLGELRQKAAVARLIDGLKSKSATARATSLDHLRRLTTDKVAAKEASWKEWWQKRSATFEYPAAAAAPKKSDGAREDDLAPAYADLDVLCFQGRFEKIEKLLDALKIVHRDTKSAAVEDAGVTPLGVVFVCCAGDALPPDLEQMRWFVHAGGLLVCSCKALTNQAAEIRHGFVRQFTAKSDADDLVAVDPCRDDDVSATVFREATRPRFPLVGAHLIDVVDPERVELLVDSAECESEWDCGALLATWSVGHGRIVACASHLESPGLECQQAPAMKDAADRMAYALDSMDYGYADLRAIPAEVWKSGNKSADEVRDLGAFRYVTGLVRRHRREAQD
jgi:HEAT repeat protein